MLNFELHSVDTRVLFSPCSHVNSFHVFVYHHTTLNHGFAQRTYPRFLIRVIQTLKVKRAILYQKFLFKIMTNWLVNLHSFKLTNKPIGNILTKLFLMLSSSSALLTVQQLLMGIISVGAVQSPLLSL